MDEMILKDVFFFGKDVVRELNVLMYGKIFLVDKIKKWKFIISFRDVLVKGNLINNEILS